MANFLIVGLAWLPVLVKGMTTFTPTVVGPYVTGQTPTSITFLIQPDNNPITGTLTIQMSGAIFSTTDGATTDYTLQDSGSVTLASTAAFSGSGTTLVITMNAANIPTGSDSTLVVNTAGLTTLPAAGAVTCDVTPTETNTALTTQAVMTVVAAPTITLTPASYAVGDQPTQLDITITLPVITASSETLTITPSATIFTGSANSDVTIDGASTMAGGPSILTFSASAITVSSGGASAVGETLKLVVAQAGLTTIPSPTGAVTFDVVHSINANTLVDNAALFTITAGAAGSDPVARWGNVIRTFELPPATLTLLLKTPQTQLFGSVFEGGGSYEQWFDRFVFTDTEHTRFLDIKIKKNLHMHNQSALKRGAFRTMDVTMGHGSFSNPSYTRAINLQTPISHNFLGSQILMRRVDRFSSTGTTSIGSLPRECADIAEVWVHFYICSSPATEYYGNFRYLAMQYAHLDMAVIELAGHEQVTGLFPELWGLQPMSEATRLLVKEDNTAGARKAEEQNAGSAFNVNETDLNTTSSKALGLCNELSDCQKINS